MLTNLRKIGSKYAYLTILFIVIFVVCITNYKWGTWLLGWDMIMPEFNFKVNFWRFLIGGFQEFQGLGVIPIMQKSADLPRLLLLWAFSYIFPISFLKWFYQFLMLFTGPFGLYFLLKYLFKYELKSRGNTDMFSFLGALYYLLNLATMQNFYAPLSMFTTWYGLLPILTLFFIKYSKLGGYKNLVIFNIFTLLAVPLSITTTNFVVYFAFTILLSICVFLANRSTLRRLILLIASILFINSFWIFSFVYSLATNAKNVSFAKINLMSSGDSFLLNKEAGTLNNISILKGFWFSNIDYFNERQVFYLMFEPWLKHLNYWYILAIGYFLFFIILLGVSYLIYKKNIILIYFLGVFVMSVFLMLNENPPFGFLFSFITSLSPLLKESLRFPFTKFSIPASFSYSIIFGFGSYFIYLVYLKFITVGVQRFQKYLGYFLFTLIIIFSFPTFTGNLIYNNLKLNLPNEYQRAFDYLNTLPAETRIADLPQITFWGWGYTNWGLRGSGFIWYGINHPITDRAFDVWNPKNEQFYNELQYAVYSKDSDLLNKVLDKYQISYLFLDKNIIAPGSTKATFIDPTIELLNKTGDVVLDNQFGDILIYKNTLSVPTDKYIYSPKQYLNTSSGYKFSNYDPIYSNNGTYITNLTNGTNYPFADDSETQKSLSKNNILSIDTGDKDSISFPLLNTNEEIPASISILDKKIVIKYLYPKVKYLNSGEYVYNPEFSEEKILNISNNGLTNYLLNDESIIPSDSKDTLLGKNSQLSFYDNRPQDIFTFESDYASSEPSDCGGSMAGSYGKLFSKNGVTLVAKNKNVCLQMGDKHIFPADSTIKVEYLYKSDTDFYPLFCLDEGNGVCLNDKYKNSSVVSKDYINHTEYINNSSEKALTLNLILENISNSEADVAIKDVKISVYKNLGDISLAPSLAAYKINTDVPVKQNNILQTEIPDLSVNYKAGSQFFNNNAKNCDNFNQINYGRELLSSGLSNYYKYSATDAVSCDRVRTLNLNGNASWLINFNYQNVKGKGLDICIAGTNLDKCVIQDRLQNNEQLKMKNEKFGNGQITSQSFILPTYPSVEDFAINIGNQGIGREETVNYLYSIDTKYLPYKWLKGVNLKSNNQLAITNTQFTNPIVKVDKSFSYFYDVTALSKNNSLMVLSQSYEDGWGMYDKNSCLFALKSPFTCKSIGKHVLVNNWSNGWLINDFGTTTNTTEFLIIFWPQYLQFFGYTLFGLWFFILTGILIFRKNNFR